MRIRPPSHDTCGECWKFKNELGVTTRLQNEANRQKIRFILNDNEIKELRAITNLHKDRLGIDDDKERERSDDEEVAYEYCTGGSVVKINDTETGQEIFDSHNKDDDEG